MFGRRKDATVPPQLEEARDAFHDLQKNSKDHLQLWGSLANVSEKLVEFSRRVFGKVDSFDTAHVAMDMEDVALLEKMHKKLLSTHSVFVTNAVAPFVDMLTFHSSQLAKFKSLDDTCTLKLERFREKQAVVEALTKKKADMSARRNLRAMQKLQDAQSDYNIAELDFVKAVKDTRMDLAYDYLLLLCNYTYQTLEKFGKGHELLVSTRKVMMEFEDIIRNKKKAYLKRKSAQDLQVSQMRALNKADSEMATKEAFLSAVEGLNPPDDPPLYHGEVILIKQVNILYIHNSRFIGGVLYATSYRILFLPYLAEVEEKMKHSPWLSWEDRNWDTLANSKPWFSVPNVSVAHVDFVGKYHMTIHCKDLTAHLVSFRHSSVKASVIRSVIMPIVWSEKMDIQDEKTSTKKDKDHYGVAPVALTHFRSWKDSKDRTAAVGWIDARNDYFRLKMGDSERSGEWQLIENKGFKLCPTYPRWIVVPRHMTKQEIAYVSQFRRKRRLPVATWCRRYRNWTIVQHINSGTFTRKQLGTMPGTPAILRCAQPKPGLSWARSRADEWMLVVLGRIGSGLEVGDRPRAGSEPKTLNIFDCRPRANAIANMAKGGGWESTKYYKNCDMHFLNIENIHVVRDSLKELKSLFESLPISDRESHSHPKSSPKRGHRRSLEISLVDRPSSRLSDASSIEGRYRDISNALTSGQASWFQHLYTILRGSNRVVDSIAMESKSAIVHCSDGWDRTPQVTALAQLQLDPYYRTLDGFSILITKEWMAYGHQFARRHGHGKKRRKAEDTQRSPIFLQWIDCVYQLMVQFPTAFQFNEYFLVKLAEHSHSCLYGNFLFDFEVERTDYEVQKRTLSIWPVLCKDPNLKNILYRKTTDTEVIKSSDDPTKLSLFLPFYKRWDSICRPVPLEIPSRLYNKTKKFSMDIDQMVGGRASIYKRPKTPLKFTRADTPQSFRRAADDNNYHDQVIESKREKNMKINGTKRLNRDLLQTALLEPSELEESVSRNMHLKKETKEGLLAGVKDLAKALDRLKTRISTFDGDSNAMAVSRSWVEKAILQVQNADGALEMAAIRSKESSDLKSPSDGPISPESLRTPRTPRKPEDFWKKPETDNIPRPGSTPPIRRSSNIGENMKRFFSHMRRDANKTPSDLPRRESNSTSKLQKKIYKISEKPLLSDPRLARVASDYVSSPNRQYAPTSSSPVGFFRESNFGNSRGSGRRGSSSSRSREANPLVSTLAQSLGSPNSYSAPRKSSLPSLGSPPSHSAPRKTSVPPPPPRRGPSQKLNEKSGSRTQTPYFDEERSISRSVVSEDKTFSETFYDNLEPAHHTSPVDLSPSPELMPFPEKPSRPKPNSKFSQLRETFETKSSSRERKISKSRLRGVSSPKDTVSEKFKLQTGRKKSPSFPSRKTSPPPPLMSEFIDNF